MFDKQDFFTLEVLVLHNKKMATGLEPIGKISGVRRIATSSSWMGTSKPSFVAEVLHGSIWVHLVRAPLYFLAGIIAMLCLVLPVIGVSGLWSVVTRKRRRKRLSSLVPRDPPLPEDQAQFLSDSFVEQGLGELQRLATLLNDNGRLLTAIKLHERHQPVRHIYDERPRDRFMDEVRLTATEMGVSQEAAVDALLDSRLVGELLEKGYISLSNEGNGVVVQGDFAEAADYLFQAIISQA